MTAKTQKFTYQPSDGDSDITEVFGQVVEAGDSIEITDERQAAKLAGHPQFRAAGQKDSPAVDRTRVESDKKLDKAIDGRSKEAKKAREAAAEAQAEADAKARAEEQARAIRDARNEAASNAPEVI